jgi:hypothetical protein
MSESSKTKAVIAEAQRVTGEHLADIRVDQNAKVVDKALLASFGAISALALLPVATNINNSNLQTGIEGLEAKNARTEQVVFDMEAKATSNLTPDSTGVPADYIPLTEKQKYNQLIAQIDQANKQISEKASQITPDSRTRDTNDALLVLAGLLGGAGLAGYGLVRKDKLAMSEANIEETKNTLIQPKEEILLDLNKQLEGASFEITKQHLREVIYQVGFTYDQAIAQCVF